MNYLTPVHYSLSLAPDLTRFTFEGICEITFETKIPVSEIKLHALELNIQSCTLKENTGVKPCQFRVDTKKEELILSLPEECRNTICLSIIYTGEINDKMAGFYRSSYKADNKLISIGVTQFEESDARRVFPCVDHPFYKATFGVEMIIDEKLQALSNEAIEKEEKLTNGKKRIYFKRTPKMSTYLLFFGVGEFEELIHDKDSRVRLYTIPGSINRGTYGLDFGQKSLAYCEDYYDIPYPLSKMDLIAVPDFAFGAMENWGAITFRENLLLFYPGITSRHGERRICEVIAHEIVHQWFGNLVTPTDWKYLWLNESFATLFGFGIVDHYHPEWEIWDQFMYEETDRALERDSLYDTPAIEIPGGEHVVINTSTAPIIYSKGGSILRQMKEYIGEELFKKGLKYYLKTHAFGNTESIDFWRAFEETSDFPVVDLMKTWIEQPGHPVISIEKVNNNLNITQKRFMYSSDTPQAEKTGSQIWHIPVIIRSFYEDGKTEDTKLLLKDKTASLPLKDSVICYKINSGQTGFYRVHYKDDKNLTSLKHCISRKTLSSRDRWGCENDMYALVKSCDISFKDYLEFLSAYENEKDYLPLLSISGHLSHSFIVLMKNWRPSIEQTGMRLYESVLDQIGYNPEKDEPFTTTLLRAQILYKALIFGSIKTKTFCLEQFDDFLQNKNIHPDIMASIMCTGAFLKPEKAWDLLTARLETTESEHDRINVLTGLSCFTEKEYILRALDYFLHKVPSRNKYIGITLMAWNPYASEYLWEWFVSHVDNLEQLHPVHYERIIASFLPMCGLQKEEGVRDFFKDYMLRKDAAQSVISLSLEWLTILIRMRKNNSLIS